MIVSITNLRADHLGTYGYSRPTSPRTDSFAGKAIVFERAFTHASWTLPAAISLFASRYPLEHGLMNRTNHRPLDRSVETLVDVLRGSGYRTGAFVGDRDYSREFGHTGRFELLYDAVNPANDEDWHSAGVLSRTVSRAVSWIRANRDRKLFAFVQGYDVHCPFAVPVANPVFDPDWRGDIDFTRCYWTFGRTRPIRAKTEAGEEAEVWILKTSPEDGGDYEEMFWPEDVRHMVALYDGEILNADAQVGLLLGELEALGLAEKTIVVILSEHGDMMGKHGRFMRGGPLRGTLYDDVIRIPLILRHPGLPPSRIGGLVELIDLAPTLLDALGLPAPAGFRGKSLRPLILDGAPVRDRVFAGSAYTPKKNSLWFRDASVALSVRTTEWKLIRERIFLETGPQDFRELFDLRSDPEELKDLSLELPERAKELDGWIDRWLDELGARPVLEAPKR